MDKATKKRLKGLTDNTVSLFGDYGMELAKRVTTDMMLNPCMIEIDLKAHKAAALNVAILGLVIDAQMFRAKPIMTALGSSDLTTFGGAAIASKLVAKPPKARLSEADRQAFTQLHDKIVAAVKFFKSKTYTYHDGTAQMGSFDASEIGTELMGIEHEMFELLSYRGF